MASKTFTHIHSSSRYDRTPSSLDRALDRYTALADLITLTEVARESREKVLGRPGWQAVTGDRSGWDDCAILFKSSRFKLRHKESFNMGGTGRYAQIVVLRDIANDKLIVVASVHYPASVEPELAARRRTADSVMWTKAVWSLKRRVNVLKRAYHAQGALIAADWNIDFKKPWARTLIKSIHPVWTNSWKAPYPTGGTHGKRLIDASLIRGTLKVAAHARLLIDDASSDHRPYINKFSWA